MTVLLYKHRAHLPVIGKRNIVYMIVPDYPKDAEKLSYIWDDNKGEYIKIGTFANLEDYDPILHPEYFTGEYK